MKQIFINLPVKDLLASMHFYKALGFELNPLFSFDDQKCMAWSDQILVMLQDYKMFQSGSLKPVADPNENTNSSFTLPVASLEQMNAAVDAALKAGGTEFGKPIDEGFMQVRSIADPDGHLWGIIYLDLDKFKQMKSK